MKKKILSTYEEFMQNHEQKKLFDEEYTELLISEMVIAAMEHDHISVRKLAAAAGVSPTIIQSIKTKSKINITLDTLSRILDAIGYQMRFVRKDNSHHQTTGYAT